MLEPLLKGFDELEESGSVSAAPAAEAPRGSRAVGAAAAVDKENAGEDEVTNDEEDGKDDRDDVGGAEDVDAENDDGENEDWDEEDGEEGGDEKDGDEEDDDEDVDAFDDADYDEMLEEELEGKSALVRSRGSREEEAVRRAAWCLFEVLLPRCVGLEGQGLETRLEEPTTFSHRCAVLEYLDPLQHVNSQPDGS